MLNKKFTPFPVLTTERLTLRQLEMKDEQEIFMLRSDVEGNKYIDRALAETIDDARKFIAMINEKIAQDDAMYWAVTLTDTHTFIGTVCLFSFSDEHDSCEIGYELLKKFQGQGLMQEAIKKVIDHCFHIIKVRTLEAVVHKDNEASINLLKKISFNQSTDPVDEPLRKWKME
ncbi:MAG TPA: GNAT family N-acetyltransferase [Chitinophagaceae bacterium]|nr:GNAT family N-acetyltransferase [Chitinophagaceae bacterium]